MNMNLKSVNFKTSLSLLALLGLAACSTGRGLVVPGEDGTNTVTSREREREASEQDALRTAKSYCEKKKLEAVFVTPSAEAKYTGKMDEETRGNIRKASKAAMVLGGMGVGVGNRGTQGAGAVLGGAGTVGSIMTSDRDYLTEMKFKCK